MKILISNDDGISAIGIKTLIKELSKIHDIYVIAPDRERSAAGHSLTLHTPIRVEELEPYFGAKRVFVTSGTPGDCVKIGINAVLAKEEQPDIVISGINHGPNLGIDILYSGTVSCAMEGAMLGKPSIAVSLAGMSMDEIYFQSTAKFILSFLKRIEKISFPEKTILNINTPALEEADIAGIQITKLGSKMFTDDYERWTDPRGKTYYRMAGQLTAKHEDDGTDIAAVRNNLISITPITFEMTHKAIMADLEREFCKDGICDWWGFSHINKKEE